MSLEPQISLSPQQIARIKELKTSDEPHIKHWLQRAKNSEQRIKTIFRISGIERDGSLDEASFDELFLEMNRISNNPALNKSLYIENTLALFNSKLKNLYFGKDPLPRRIDDFLELKGVRIYTASHFLLIFDPTRYPIATRNGLDQIGITDQQRATAKNIALKRFGIDDLSLFTHETQNYLIELVLYEALKNALELDSFSILNRFLFMIRVTSLSTDYEYGKPRILKEELVSYPILLSVKNFGPIKNAEIEIKRLTLIIGKNNIGKSYLAQLIYVFLIYRNSILFRRDILPYYYFGVIRDDNAPSFIKRWREQLTNFGHEILDSNPTNKQILEKCIQFVLDIKRFPISTELSSLFGQFFGRDLKDLVNINSNHSQIKCDIIKGISLEVLIRRKGELTLKFRPQRDTISTLEAHHMQFIQKIRRSRKRTTELLADLCGRIDRDLFGFERRLAHYRTSTDQSDSIYVPAGRAGLIESYETVASALITLSGTAWRGISMPPMPGLASQFYDTLMSLEGRKGPFFEKVSGLFKEILQGDILIEKVPYQKQRPKFLYKFGIGKKTQIMELLHSASMIKELAPIYLLIRERINAGNWLIIEEPESHLHPGAQYKLLNVIRELVDGEVNVVLTTHSDIILIRIAHMVGEAKLSGQMKNLNTNEVRIYLLKEEEKGSESKELKIVNHGALEEIPTFDEVIKELYEEEILLQTKIKMEE